MRLKSFISGWKTPPKPAPPPAEPSIFCPPRGSAASTSTCSLHALMCRPCKEQRRQIYWAIRTPALSPHLRRLTLTSFDLQ